MFSLDDLKEDDCRSCYGCGQIASGEEGAPWIMWEEMPEESKLAVLMGLVGPIPCPQCDGTGKK